MDLMSHIYGGGPWNLLLVFPLLGLLWLRPLLLLHPLLMTLLLLLLLPPPPLLLHLLPPLPLLPPLLLLRQIMLLLLLHRLPLALPLKLTPQRIL